MQQVVVLETILWRGPLGLRFLDLARGVTVSDGLLVAAWPVNTRGPKQPGVPSPLSGVYGFRRLPGLSRFESGDPAAVPPGDALLSSPPTAEELLDLGLLRELVEADEGAAAPNFIITVEDSAGRFLPQVLLMALPKTQVVEVPLFSAPARPALSGFGAVRGELWDREANGPAGWALVTASIAGQSPLPQATYATVADARGMFALFVPYASALPPLEGSPPHGSAGDQLTWPLTIAVFYQPATQRRLPSLDPPDTRSILEQTPALVYDAPGLPGPSVTRPIRFGDDAVVATRGLPRLLVDPAPGGSPP